LARVRPYRLCSCSSSMLAIFLAEVGLCRCNGIVNCSLQGVRPLHFGFDVCEMQRLESDSSLKLGLCRGSRIAVYFAQLDVC
jgi:hypothetical protein